MTRFHSLSNFALLVLATLLCLSGLIAGVSAADDTCVADPTLAQQLGSPGSKSCCQSHVCDIPCPDEVPSPGKGYGIATIVAIVISFIIGALTYFLVHGQTENFFVAGRTLPLFVVAITLGSQSIDSNSLLGNVDLSYQFHFYDGAALPIGLGLSLLLNALFFARKMQQEEVLTLPDVYARRYGRVVEVLVSLATCVSFVFLLAGNLVGMGRILSYVFPMNAKGAVWLSAVVVWFYTACGGLFSVAYTDVAQGIVGWLGALVCCFWLLANKNPGAPPPSAGFPGYIYLDKGTCNLYNGISCVVNATQCCYNEGASVAQDNGAYRSGDQRIFQNQMFSALSLSPFPNAILWNWATIFILAFGNLGALDFQVRCMASRTPLIATVGCIIAGFLTFLIGIPFSYLGSLTRVFYGPDSVHAEFTADTCSTILGLPTCAEWVPDQRAFLHLLTQQAPGVLGGWCLITLVSASMSTSDGAILALGTVFTHNILRQLTPWFPSLLKNNRLLLMARLSTLPFAVIAGAVAAFSEGITGKLLIVAFDVVLATVIAPLFGAFYTNRPSALAALLSFVCGAATRIVLEFTLPKDGSFLLPYSKPEFLNYGPAASQKLPTFIDETPENVWNPDTEPCSQSPWKDYSGIDSLSAFAVSIVVFIAVQAAEHYKDGPLFRFPGDVGYDKVPKEVGGFEEESPKDMLDESEFTPN